MRKKERIRGEIRLLERNRREFGENSNAPKPLVFQVLYDSPLKKGENKEHPSSAVGNNEYEVYNMNVAVQYQEILAQFPVFMSKEQMCRVCKISKKTCRYLLESGLVPCRDRGTQTHRFQIKTSDVIRYLKAREQNPEKYKPPLGYYKPGSFLLFRQKNVISQIELQIMRSFYEEKLDAFPDVLTPQQIAIFTGYSDSTVNQWCEKEALQHFLIKNKRYIPKTFFVDFLVSWRYIRISVKSDTHRNMNRELSRLLRSHC